MRFVNLEPGKVSAKAQVYSIPAQTDYAEFITGQAFSDKEGTLKIEETFNLPVFPGTLINTYGGIVLPTAKVHAPVERWGENQKSVTAKEVEEEEAERTKERKEKEEKLIEKWMEEATWSVCTYPEKEFEHIQATASFTVKAKEALSFNCYAGGPFWRISFKSESETKELKILARAFERGKV